MKEMKMAKKIKNEEDKEKIDQTQGSEGCCESCGCGCENCSGCADESQNAEKEVDEKSFLAEQYLNIARQVQADFDNYRKRNEKSREESLETGKMSIIVQILPLADAIDKAVSVTTDETTKQGLIMLQGEFIEILANAGVEKYVAVGQQFDANLHCAITMLDSDKPSGTIIEEVQSGYKSKDRIVRYAQVVVAK